MSRVTKITFPNNDHTDIVTGIKSGSLSLDEILCSSSDLKFGECNSSCFSCKLLIPDDLSGKDIKVYYDTTLIFTGTIESCIKDGTSSSVKSVVAYDKWYYVNNKNLALWWNSFWTNKESSTIKDLRDALFSELGITQKTTTLVSDNVSLSKHFSTNKLTASSIVKAICQTAGVFGRITRDGKFEYVTLGGRSHNITSKYRKSSQLEEWAVSAINRVEILNENNETGATAGVGTNTYSISGNFLLYGMDSTSLQAVANIILQAVGGFTYTPAEIKMILSDFDIELGDKVTIGDIETYVLENSYSGSQLISHSIGAKGSKDRSGVKDTIEETKMQVESIVQNIGSLIADKVDTSYLQANYVDATTLRTNYLKADVANITEAGIKKLYADTGVLKNVKVEEGKVTGALDSVEVNADRITGGTLIVDRLYHLGDDGKYHLTKVGADGKTEYVSDGVDGDMIAKNSINADRIIAHSITSTEIDATDIFSKNITASNLNITGGSVNINNKFIVGTDGSVSMKSANIDGYATSEEVDKLESQLDGEVEYYQLTNAPTLANYPAWDFTYNIPCNDTVQTTDSLKFAYTEDYYRKNLRSLVFNETDSSSYRFSKKTEDTGTVTFYWSQVSDSDFGVAMKKIATLEADSSGLRSDVNATYAKVTEQGTSIATLSTNLTQTDKDVSAKVSKVDGTSSTNCSWNLTSDKFSVSSKGTEVLKIDDSGLTVHGNGSFSGTITSTNATITGGSISITNSKGVEKFKVSASGLLEAHDATIYGGIVSTSGRIGGLKISNGFLSKDKTSISDNSDGVYLGTDGIALGANNTFKVTNTGHLKATNADIEGTITSSNATITGGSLSMSGTDYEGNAVNMTIKNGQITSSSGTCVNGSLSVNTYRADDGTVSGGSLFVADGISTSKGVSARTVSSDSVKCKSVSEYSTGGGVGIYGNVVAYNDVTTPATSKCKTLIVGDGTRQAVIIADDSSSGKSTIVGANVNSILLGMTAGGTSITLGSGSPNTVDMTINGNVKVVSGSSTTEIKPDSITVGGNALLTVADTEWSLVADSSFSTNKTFNCGAYKTMLIEGVASGSSPIQTITVPLFTLSTTSKKYSIFYSGVYLNLTITKYQQSVSISCASNSSGSVKAIYLQR